MSNSINVEGPASTEPPAKPFLLSADGSVARIAYQGEGKLPPGTRRTLGRQTRMLAAVDRETLTKRHKAIIKSAIVKYADGDGIFFPDQRDWANEAGCDVKLVTAAVHEAVGSGLLTKMSRVYTTTRRRGTSVYMIAPELWSKDPESVRKSASTRLSSLDVHAPKTVDGPCTENGATERVVASLYLHKDEEAEKPSVFDEESGYRLMPPSRPKVCTAVHTSLGRESLENPTPSNGSSRPKLELGLEPSAATNSPWPRPGRVTRNGKTREVFLESEGAYRLLQDEGYHVEYQTRYGEPVVWDRPIPGRTLVAA